MHHLPRVSLKIDPDKQGAIYREMDLRIYPESEAWSWKFVRASVFARASVLVLEYVRTYSEVSQECNTLPKDSVSGVDCPILSLVVLGCRGSSSNHMGYEL
jgi:hypothetical protein